MAKKKSNDNNKIAASVEQDSIYNLVTSGYLITSKYFAEYRLIPSIYDGMKPVYRRILQVAYEVCRDKFIKTVALAGQVVSRLHPHGADAVAEVINELVNSGLLVGDGEFGSKYLDGTVAEAANGRYTSVKLNPYLRDIFDKLLKYIPMKDGELEAKEYEYLPLPLPYMLYQGGFGLGPGLSTKTPAFTMQSMVKALESDDPSLLKSTYKYELLDIKNSKKKLWETGNGFAYYKLAVGKETLGGINGAYIMGSAQAFFPKLNTLEEWKANGWVSINEVGKGVSKLFVGKNKGVSSITVDDIYKELDNISVYKDTIILKVIAPDGVVHPIGLRTWIKNSYDKFMSLVEAYKKDQIQEIQKRIDMMKSFDVIKECIIKHIRDSEYTPEKIAKETGKNIDIVREIDSWSVNRLRKTVAKDELAKLNKQLAEAKKFDCKNYANSVIVQLDSFSTTT